MSNKSNVKVFRRGKQGRVLDQLLAQTQQNVTQTQLMKTVKELAAEVESLQQRLVQIEQGTRPHQETTEFYRVPQSLSELGPRRLPPPGQTAMQAIMGKLEVEEPIEELLAQLKALD